MSDDDESPTDDARPGAEHSELEQRLHGSSTGGHDGGATTAPDGPATADVEQADRRRLWMTALGAVAVVAVLAIVVPILLPGSRATVDVAEVPRDSVAEAPEGEGEEAPEGAVADGPAGVDGATVDPLVADSLRAAGLAYADGAGVHVDGQVVIGFAQDAPWPSSLATSTSVAGGDGWGVAAGFENGAVGLALADGGLRQLPEGRANGGGVAFSPDGRALGWIDGRELHVVLLDTLVAAGAEPQVRVLPLAGSPPDDLVLQDWAEGADAQVIIASRAGDGLWRIPMDAAGAAETRPVPTTAPLPDGGGEHDGLLLPDLSLVTVRAAEAGVRPASMTRDGGTTGLPAITAATVVRTSNDDEGAFVISDGQGGSLLAVAGEEVDAPVAMRRFWSDPALLLAAPLDVPDELRSSSGQLVVPDDPSLGTRG